MVFRKCLPSNDLFPMFRRCASCKKDLPQERFTKSNSRWGAYCRTCGSTASRKHRNNRVSQRICYRCPTPLPLSWPHQLCESHHKEALATSKVIAQRTKDAAFNSYGGYRCACCGIVDEVFLTLDHVNGGGNKHRNEISPDVKRWGGGGGCKLYRWLKKNKYPRGFQVLCFNCNFAKWRLGKCPHNP